jgi:ethanolamine ammonia-lyase large subunit
MYGATLGNHRYNFSNLATLLAKASPLRSGDILAGIAVQSGEERVAAQFALADLLLRTFHLISYESDEITRLIADMHNAKAVAAISHLTVGAATANADRARYTSHDQRIAWRRCGMVLSTSAWSFTRPRLLN